MLDQPVGIDEKYLEMATKIVSASLNGNQPAGMQALNNPATAVALLRAVAIELVTLRRGEYELPQKK